jgi:hypothetical protein
MGYNNHNMKMEEEDKKICYNRSLNDFVKDIMENYQMLKVWAIHDYIDRNYDRVNPLFCWIKSKFYAK